LRTATNGSPVHFADGGDHLRLMSDFLVRPWAVVRHNNAGIIASTFAYQGRIGGRHDRLRRTSSTGEIDFR
jgi:hypothetical protein